MKRNITSSGFLDITNNIFTYSFDNPCTRLEFTERRMICDNYVTVKVIGSSARYTCLKNHVPDTGDMVRFCHKGFWTGVTPTCKAGPWKDKMTILMMITGFVVAITLPVLLVDYCLRLMNSRKIQAIKQMRRNIVPTTQTRLNFPLASQHRKYIRRSVNYHHGFPLLDRAAMLDSFAENYKPTKDVTKALKLVQDWMKRNIRPEYPYYLTIMNLDLNNVHPRFLIRKASIT